MQSGENVFALDATAGAAAAALLFALAQGFLVRRSRGVTAALIYLFVYAFMQLGAFTVIVVLHRRDVVGDELKDFSGLHVRHPFAAFAMLLFMLSLGGIPPTAGFAGVPRWPNTPPRNDWRCAAVSMPRAPPETTSTPGMFWIASRCFCPKAP